MEPTNKSQAELYSRFKGLQKQFQQNRKSFTIDQLIEGYLLEDCCVIINQLVEDLEFSLKKDIPQRLMNLIKLYISSYLDKHDQDTFLRNIDPFYNKLSSIIKTILRVLIQNYDASSLVRVEKNQVISRMCAYYAQVLEHREKKAHFYNLPKNMKNIQAASNFYLKAINIYPYVGTFYSRLAELTAYNGDLFSACYWSMRAETCEIPEGKNQVLVEKLNEQANKKISKEFKDVGEGLMNLSLHLVVYHSQKPVDASFIEWDQLLRKVIHQLVNPTDMQLSILSFTIQLCLANIYKQIEEGNKLKKPYFQLLQNFSYRKIIRNNFYIIFSILEIFNKVSNETIKEASYLLMPVINFWMQFPNILKVLLVDFKELPGWMVNLLNKYSGLKTRDRLSYKIFEKEVNLIGWIVLRDAYEGRILELQKDPEVIISWVVSSIKLLPIDFSTNPLPIKARYPNVQVQKTLETKDKNLIVVDGRNVAIKHGNHQYFSSKGLKLIADYWRNKGYNVIIILPEYCFSDKEIEIRREQKLKEVTLPDDTSIILKLKSEGVAVGVPDKDYDDAYIVEFALDKKAFLVSNDKFKEFREDTKLPMNKRVRVREFLRDNLMSYTFFKDDFYPNPEFKKNNNIL